LKGTLLYLEGGIRGGGAFPRTMKNTPTHGGPGDTRGLIAGKVGPKRADGEFLKKEKTFDGGRNGNQQGLPFL